MGNVVAPGKFALDWTRGRMDGWDTETTAKDPLMARLVTASVVETGADATGPEGASYAEHHWLVAVDEEIPQEATDKHGVTTEHAREHGRPLSEVLVEMCEVLTSTWAAGRPLVVFNAPYDFTVLQCELGRCGLPLLQLDPKKTPILDPLVCDKALDKYRKGSRKLGDMCLHYGVTLENAHTSAADSLAACDVMRKIAAKFPHLGMMTTSYLTRVQAGWFAEWAKHYEGYLRSQCRTEGGGVADLAKITVSREWPVQELAGAPMRVGGRQR